MKKFLTSRTFNLILGGAALLALVLLAAGLGSIEFAPARSFQSGQASANASGGVMLPELPLWQQILFWVVILALLVSIFAVISPKGRKQLAQRLGSLTIVMLVLAYLGFKYGAAVQLPTPAPSEAAPVEAQPGQSVGMPTGQPQELPPPTVPPSVSFIVTLAIVCAVAALAWWLIRWGQGRRAAPPLEELAGIARAALDDLSAGKDWGDTIVACYARMEAAVGERRGFKRKRGATPAEFADELERAGLPGYTTRRLTQLFERVRYGAKQSSREDIQEAVACLTDILHACGEAL